MTTTTIERRPRLKREPKEAEKPRKKVDPLTGATNYHPVASGVGAATGGVLGAVAGALGGPGGVALGATVGGMIGGLIGKGTVTDYDEAYWRDTYTGQPYYIPEYSFDDYSPAYRYGHETYHRFRGKSFADVEPELEKGWQDSRGTSRLTWDTARNAVRRVWYRIEESLPGDADGDGR